MTTQQLTAVAKNYEVWDEDKTPFRKVLRWTPLPTRWTLF